MLEKYDGIILASASPRRRELLGLIGIKDFKIIPADSEADYPSGMEPGKAAEYIALKKAESVLGKIGGDPSGSLILAADTIVWLDGAALGKPADAEDAKRMLRALSGKKHTVYSGIALLDRDGFLTGSAATDVWFKSLSDSEIEAYVATGQPLDKAGAYGAQDLAALFVSRIEGEYFNVIGLPLYTLGTMLSRLGASPLQ
jgi:septum formation protein